MSRSSLVSIALAVFVSTLLGTPASAELLLHYTFDEAASGTTPALDSGAPPPANGIFNGTSTRSDSDLLTNSVASFDTNGGAIDDYLYSPNPEKLNELEQFTLVTWMNLQSAPVLFDRLISKHDTGTAGFDWFIDNPSSGSFSESNLRLTVTVNGADGTDRSNDLNVGLNNWVFLAVTYDGSTSADNIRFYMGTETDLADQVGLQSNSAGQVDDTNADLRVAGTNRSGSDRTGDALFDDVRIYNSPLSQVELRSIQSEHMLVPEPGSLALHAGFIIAALLVWRRRRC